MRVLFVDDEPRVLRGIENALIFAGADLDAGFASSGEEAIAALAASRFDVLVSDMIMPGLTGADVLEHARSHHPLVTRVVFSGEVDPELAQRAMPLTHEYISKPCEPTSLIELVRTVYRASRSLDSPIIAELVGGMVELPVQPRIFNRIQDSIVNGDGVAAVADIVESDIAIATMVLRTANSAFYGFRSPANSVRDAVSRLGSVVVSGIALNAELAANAPPEIVAELEALNSIAASVARIVRKLIGTECPQASLAALLRDIGVVILQLNMTEAYRPVQDHFNLTGHRDQDSELRCFGATHADVGAYVLRMWKVDALVVEAVQFHRQIAGATSTDARHIIQAMAAADAALRPDRDFPFWVDTDLVSQAREIVESSAR